MVIALLAVLGVDLIVIVAFLTGSGCWPDAS
jgi:hypothetical protein